MHNDNSVPQHAPGALLAPPAHKSVTVPWVPRIVQPTPGSVSAVFAHLDGRESIVKVSMVYDCIVY